MYMVLLVDLMSLVGLADLILKSSSGLLGFLELDHRGLLFCERGVALDIRNELPKFGVESLPRGRKQLFPGYDV